MEDFFEEFHIGFAGNLAIDLIHAPAGPGMHRRIDVAKGPFIGRNLTIGMHVPFAQEQVELALGKVGIDEGHGDHVKR